jgi:quinol monooxygenase YgiN
MAISGTARCRHHHRVKGAAWLGGMVTAGLLAVAAHLAMSNHASPLPLPIVELRQYKLHPGKRDALIDLFEREFIESQEALGMAILGTFRDLDDPDRFVWLRGFTDMRSRASALHAFYSGPVWQAHRNAANATMVDSDDVLLLRVVRAGPGFFSAARKRAPQGASAIAHSFMVASIYYFASDVEPPFIEFFERVVSPALLAADIRVGATYVSETRPNDFPRLPVRENERVFVWFSTHRDARAYEQSLARLRQSAEWISIRDELRSKLMRDPEVHRLEPTPRSALCD